MTVGVLTRIRWPSWYSDHCLAASLHWLSSRELPSYIIQKNSVESLGNHRYIYSNHAKIHNSISTKMLPPAYTARYKPLWAFYVHTCMVGLPALYWHWIHFCARYIRKIIAPLVMYVHHCSRMPADTRALNMHRAYTYSDKCRQNCKIVVSALLISSGLNTSYRHELG